MAESSSPTIAGSRSVADQEYEVMSSGFAADGVMVPWSSSTPVFGDSSGRQVKVRANFYALVGGHYYSSGTSDLIKSISANASGSTRIDLVVLGLNRSTLAVTSYVKNGTPGAGVPPALQRDARGLTTGIWEIPLAQVTVVNGAATIAAGDVTNIGWFSSGSTVVTTSTSALQPPVADYSELRHSDTGLTYEAVSGAWRRAPWGTAWGFQKGNQWTGSGSIYSLTTSMADSGMRTGSYAFLAGRMYKVRFRAWGLFTATSDVWVTTYVQIRLGDGSTIIGEESWTQPYNLTPWRLVEIQYAPGSNTTQNLQLWAQMIKSSGTTLSTGTIQRQTGTLFTITDDGLSSGMSTL